MTEPSLERRFAGSIPQIYETHFVPVLFAPYASDLAERLRTLTITRVLELAAGTGAVTRAMAQTLPSYVAIVATDLNAAMLEQAARTGVARDVEWRQADAMQLPFDDQSFDAVVCQFGVMFFPDRPKAYAEARRVLKPGGTLLFSTWDRLEVNEFDHAAQCAADAAFPADPPRFFADVPHGYFERERIVRDVAAAGFERPPSIETVAKRSRAESARMAATALCCGTPLRNQIEARDASRLSEVVDRTATILADRFGSGAIEGGMQAHVVQATR